MKTMTTRPVRLAAVFGMDPETRSALTELENLAKKGNVAIAGKFMPDQAVSQRLAARGIVENVDEADFFRYSQIVIPFTGASLAKRRQWETFGVPIVDLTSPQIRRAQVALGLLRMDGAQPLVIGRHADAESKGLMAGNPGARIIQDTTDTARLQFAPSFGAVCQTTLSPRRVAWLVQQLRHRYNDARVTFLDTSAPAMKSREASLEKLIPHYDRVIIVGQSGESSCEALAETALRLGKSSMIISRAADLQSSQVIPGESIAMTAGAFALDSTIREVADALLRF